MSAPKAPFVPSLLGPIGGTSHSIFINRLYYSFGSVSGFRLEGSTAPAQLQQKVNAKGIKLKAAFRPGRPHLVDCASKLASVLLAMRVFRGGSRCGFIF